MNWGWYVVYMLMIIGNVIMCYVHDFTVLTWQYWTWSLMYILTFVAGSNYKK